MSAAVLPLTISAAAFLPMSIPDKAAGAGVLRIFIASPQGAIGSTGSIVRMRRRFVNVVPGDAPGGGSLTLAPRATRTVTPSISISMSPHVGSTGVSARALVALTAPAAELQPPRARTAATLSQRLSGPFGVLAGAEQNSAWGSTQIDEQPPKPPRPAPASLRQSAPCHPLRTDDVALSPFSPRAGVPSPPA